MDSARLLSCMFGTPGMKKAFLLTKKPLTRAEMDDRLSMNRIEKFWHDVSTAFSNPENAVEICVESAEVFTYLQGELDTTHRRSVSAGECQKQYENLRASYESSDAVGRYNRSGQGNPNFFPLFCMDNPIHVYLHYIMREDRHKSGSDDLSIATFSLIDPKKHVNSMSMPAGSTPFVDEDIPSAANPAAGVTREYFYSRLDKAISKVMDEHVSGPAKRPRSSIVDMLEKKVRVKKLRMQLKTLQEEDPDSNDEDYARDCYLLSQELSTINNALTKARNEHTRDPSTMSKVSR